MSVPVLNHYNRGIHQNSNRQRQPAERHDVGAYVQVIHRYEGHRDRNRQRDDRNQRRAKMEEKDDNYEADDDGLFHEVALQRLDGFLDQTGAVVTRHYFHAWRKRRFDLRELLLDAVDYCQSVQAVAHHHDAAYGFAIALPFDNAFPHIWTE